MTLEGLPPVWQAAILGVVQGLSEFLPISSSAHLVAVPRLLGWEYLGKGFDVALHVGTLLALLLHFRSDLGALLRGTARYLSGRRDKAACAKAHLAQNLVLASIPVALAGFLLDDVVERHLQGLIPMAVFLGLWGILLGWADHPRFAREQAMATLDTRMALLIGCAQAMALLPGTSRSGATITMALLLGLSRSEAVRFSLLLSLPVVAGAALFRGWSLAGGTEGGDALSVVLVGIAASAVAGRICLRDFLRYVERGSLRPFMWYRLIFAAALLYWALVGA